jgi:hypothetical protein
LKLVCNIFSIKKPLFFSGFRKNKIRSRWNPSCIRLRHLLKLSAMR